MNEAQRGRVGTLKRAGPCTPGAQVRDGLLCYGAGFFVALQRKQRHQLRTEIVEEAFPPSGVVRAPGELAVTGHPGLCSAADVAVASRLHRSVDLRSGRCSLTKIRSSITTTSKPEVKKTAMTSSTLCTMGLPMMLKLVFRRIGTFVIR